MILGQVRPGDESEFPARSKDSITYDLLRVARSELESGLGRRSMHPVQEKAEAANPVPIPQIAETRKVRCIL